jgi:hypothetical protein
VLQNLSSGLPEAVASEEMLMVFSFGWAALLSVLREIETAMERPKRGMILDMGRGTDFVMIGQEGPNKDHGKFPRP